MLNVYALGQKFREITEKDFGNSLHYCAFTMCHSLFLRHLIKHVSSLDPQKTV